MNRVTALLPMRHSSERVKGKNYRLLGGRPLYQHVLASLLEVESIDQVVIDTDSPIIVEQVSAGFPDVVLLDRPTHLRAGEIPMTDVLQHDAHQVESRFYLQTHSTNPLLRSTTIEAAVDAFLQAWEAGEADSLFSVTRLQTRLYDADGKAVNHDPAVLLRTQDLPPLFEENSNIYLFPRDLILGDGRRIGDRPLMFETDPLESVDIDEETDFLLAESLHGAGVSS